MEAGVRYVNTTVGYLVQLPKTVQSEGRNES